MPDRRDLFRFESGETSASCRMPVQYDEERVPLLLSKPGSRELQHNLACAVPSKSIIGHAMHLCKIGAGGQPLDRRPLKSLIICPVKGMTTFTVTPGCSSVFSNE